MAGEIIVNFEDGRIGYRVPEEQHGPADRYGDAYASGTYEAGRGGIVSRLKWAPPALADASFSSDHRFGGKPLLAGVGLWFKPVLNRSWVQFGWSGGTQSLVIEFLFNDPQSSPGKNLYINGGSFPGVPDEHLSVDTNQWFNIRLMSTGYWEIVGDRTGLISSGSVDEKMDSDADMYSYAIAGPGRSGYDQGPGEALVDDLYVFPAISGDIGSVRREFAPSRQI